MDAMIFAAGLGTRMRPLTDTQPKALVAVNGRSLLDLVLERVMAAGATRIVVNTSHLAEQVETWLRWQAPPGVEVLVSREPDGPYDTGGGLIAARALFRGDGPILLHNVDVLSRIPLDQQLAAHAASGALATLAVQNRRSSRKLLFDDDGLLGRLKNDEKIQVREPRGAVSERAFSGIHVIQPELLGLIRRTGTFSMIDVYLDLAEQGHAIRAWDASPFDWIDVGTPERLREAESRSW